MDFRAQAEYDVFARRKRGLPLARIGSVFAPSSELARFYAVRTYDEENWLEMVVVPRSAEMRVTPLRS